MRKNPERTAWLVLTTALLIFGVTVVAIPLGVRWYLLNAEDQHDATLESLRGTVVIEPPIGEGSIPLGKDQKMPVAIGTVIRVDETSDAVLTFFDHSHMRLFSGTTIRLEEMSSPRYEKLSQLANRIHLTLLGGRIQVGTAMSLDTPLDFQVTTLQGESILSSDGSYSVEANNERAEVSAYRGHARLVSTGQEVSLKSGERSQVLLNEAPQPATGLARNLLTNGEFIEPLENGWLVFNDQGTDGGQVDGKVEVVVDEGHHAVRFVRLGGQGNHCETVLESSVDQLLLDPVSSLVVRATVKVRYQSLSGGGYLSSEYPLMIRLTYRDVYDSEAEWVQGFYYQNTDNNPTMYGQQISHDGWYLFESENLLETLPIRPYKLIRLRVYASGWDYESLISDISLIVE